MGKLKYAGMTVAMALSLALGLGVASSAAHRGSDISSSLTTSSTETTSTTTTEEQIPAGSRREEVKRCHDLLKQVKRNWRDRGALTAEQKAALRTEYKAKKQEFKRCMKLWRAEHRARHKGWNRGKRHGGHSQEPPTPTTTQPTSTIEQS